MWSFDIVKKHRDAKAKAREDAQLASLVAREKAEARRVQHSGSSGSSSSGGGFD